MPGKRVKGVNVSPSVRTQKGCWVESEEDYFVPSWKPNFPDKQTGYIKDGCLYALVESGTKITSGVDGTALPARSDSVYIHPDTMKQCNIAVATPTVLARSGQVVGIVKPWPTRTLCLDRVGVSSALSHSIGDGDDLVCLYSLPVKTSSVAVATNVTLKYSSGSGSVPVNKSFHNYVLIKNDGVLVVEGSVLSVIYDGREMFFSVESLSSSSVIDISSDSLSTSLQQLSFNSPPRSSDLANKENWGATPTRSLDTSKPLFSTPRDCNNLHTATPITCVMDGAAIGKLSVSSTKLDFIDENKPVLQVTRPSLSSIGGLKEQIKLLLDLVALPLSSPDIIKGSGVNFPHGVLLYGPPGNGKTLLAEAIAGHALCPSHVMDSFDIVDGQPNSQLDRLMKEVESGGVGSLDESSYLLVVNDVDQLFNDQGSTPQLRTLVKLFNFINHPSCQRHVVVIATTNRIDSVSGGLRQPGRFDLEVEVPAPRGAERGEILQLLLQGIPNTLEERDVERIALSAHGYVGLDLKAVCREAQYIAFRRQLASESRNSTGNQFGWSLEVPLCSQRVEVCPDDVQKGMMLIKPTAMREISVEVPKVLWSDIGGQESIKMKLKECVEWPLKYPEVFKRLGVSPPAGVLLYGPPGCSKTMIARALATESGLNFLSVKGPELFSKWVGDSERAVRQVFSRARAVAPSIIFFDEIDALATHRQGEGSKVGDRVLAQLLTEMDGLVSLSNVIIIAATNRPDILDKALLRPGRIDRLIYVSLPSPETRQEIFQIQFSHTPVSDDVSVDELVSLTDFYSGAEIVALVQEAALNAMHEDISSQNVARRHFLEALTVVRPRTDAKTVDFYQKYNNSGIVS